MVSRMLLDPPLATPDPGVVVPDKGGGHSRLEQVAHSPKPSAFEEVNRRKSPETPAWIWLVYLVHLQNPEAKCAA